MGVDPLVSSFVAESHPLHQVVCLRGPPTKRWVGGRRKKKDRNKNERKRDKHSTNVRGLTSHTFPPSYVACLQRTTKTTLSYKHGYFPHPDCLLLSTHRHTVAVGVKRYTEWWLVTPTCRRCMGWEASSPSLCGGAEEWRFSRPRAAHHWNTRHDAFKHSPLTRLSLTHSHTHTCARKHRK